MRRDHQFLTDILEAAESISQFLKDRTSESFRGDDLLRSAILHKLTVIGEAAARVSPELKARYAEVPWSGIVGFRNIAVHAYFSVNWGIVWVTASEEIPELEAQIRTILVAEPE
ncbi:MAG TPA: DUF86 domain-containing protein [Thermoanaerobaculia bacterium]|jgi:uncharacterized protein with HEPN domain